jgi:hypothetical protein
VTTPAARRRAGVPSAWLSGPQPAGSSRRPGFATPVGQPINPRTDYTEWKRLLKEAGLREARLRDARHTAATVLLLPQQPTPTVMSLMGWSSESMAARYQHVTDALRSQVASQVGQLIWETPGVAEDRDQARSWSPAARSPSCSRQSRSMPQTTAEAPAWTPTLWPRSPA